MTHEKLFRLKIKSNSMLKGNISSNTFFGAFCQAYKIKYNEDRLESFLTSLLNNSGELTFSDPLECDKYTFKKFDNIHTINCVVDRNNKSNIMLNSNRLSVKEFDVLLYTTLTEDEITELSRIVEILGIGADRSIGNGSIIIEEIRDEQLPKHSKCMRLLSSIVPDEDTPVDGSFEFITRSGITCEGKEQDSIIQIKAGSILVNNSVDKPVYGVVLHDLKTQTYINCKGIAV